MIDPFCLAENCNRASACAGYCIMHYKRLKRNGTTDRILRSYTEQDRCEHCKGCGPFYKGLCKPCSLRNYRKGYPDRDIKKKGEGTITKAGYKLMTTKYGEREYEHRLITKAKIREVVHHKDNNPLNNSPDNLEVLPSQSEHMKLHRKGMKHD